MQGERRFRWAVVSACALHALLLVGITLHPRQGPPRLASPVREPLVGVELAFREAFEPAPSVPTPENPQQGEPGSSAPSGARAGRLPRSAVKSEMAESATAEAATGEDAIETEATPQPSTAPGSTSESARGSSNGRARIRPRRSGLGDDLELAYALSRHESAPSATERAEDNLRRSMQQEQADADLKLGLNVPAPLILAIESAAREVAIPTNSVAVFIANIDGSGQLLGLEYTGSNHASPQWTKLTQRVEQALRGRKLPIAKRVKGVDLKLRLIARAQLPSGADPGLGVNLLGIPLKKGEGKRSSKITILDPIPKLLQLEVPGTHGPETIKVPVLSAVATILNVAGDPADIGAPVRQMVRVEVIEERLR